MKTWVIPSKNLSEPKRLGSIFECSKCRVRFRSVLRTETERKATSIADMVSKVKNIKVELTQTLRNLRGKIKKLETERATLMIEIEELRKAAESRADALENEVSILRNEVKSLKALLGYPEQEDTNRFDF